MRHFIKLIVIVFISLTIAQSPTFAQDQRVLGAAWIGSNDQLGDGKDRWRSGALTLSVVAGRDIAAGLPSIPGRLLEFRLTGQTVTPDDFDEGGRRDRRYAGVLALGLHTHFESRGWQGSLGLDLVSIGPSNGLHLLHDNIHELFGGPEVPPEDEHVSDTVYLTGKAEAAREVSLGTPLATIRPFAAVQVGHETLARIGADLRVGPPAPGGVRARDPIAGFLYPVVPGEGGRLPFLMIGGDVAAVASSALLNDEGRLGHERIRHRLRTGIGMEAGGLSGFAGVAWLGPEFRDQSEGQVVGSVSMGLRF